jgi:type II secretory pathway predicted ATPase ExeA
MLDADQLEGLRLLTNSEMDSHAPFTQPVNYALSPR